MLPFASGVLQSLLACEILCRELPPAKDPEYVAALVNILIHAADPVLPCAAARNLSIIGVFCATRRRRLRLHRPNRQCNIQTNLRCPMTTSLYIPPLGTFRRAQACAAVHLTRLMSRTQAPAE